MATLQLRDGRTVTFELNARAEGEVSLTATASDDDTDWPWFIATITEDGLYRHMSVHESLGVAVNDDGRIKLTETR